MTWTKSGSVNLTNGNAVVYGTGTAWVSGGMARPGDVMIAPNGALYEVASIQSNTQLTLSSAYLGSTASDQSYSLIHTGLLPSELAINLSSLQSKYLTTISQLWEWETSNEATVPLTNPATGVTTNVKPIAGLVLDVSGKAPIASPSFTGTLTHSGDVVMSGSGKRITGDFSNATIANRLMFQTSIPSGTTSVGVIPAVGAGASNINVFSNSEPLNSDSQLQLLSTVTETSIRNISPKGAGYYTPMSFYTGGAERMRIDTSGNVLVTSPAALGYGPGAGGTVTQATSKSTAVTLNKPCGMITTAGDALAPNAVAIFTVNCSLISIYDGVLITPVGPHLGVAYNYQYEVITGSPGLFYITIRNVSGVTLTEFINLGFSIIKGAIS